MYRLIRASLVQRAHSRKYSTIVDPEVTNSQPSTKILLSDEIKESCIKKCAAFSKEIPEHFQSNLRKRAAVLIPLCEVNGEPSLLFTQRSHGLRRSRGEVSFPGGNEDDDDRNLVYTALRETEEEIGLAAHRVDVWTILPAIPDYSFRLGVHAVLGNIGKVNMDEFTINEDEVARIFTLPLSFLLDSENARYTRFRIGKKVSEYDYTCAVFLSEPKVWGLTGTFVDITLSFLFENYTVLSNIQNQRYNRFLGR